MSPQIVRTSFSNNMASKKVSIKIHQILSKWENMTKRIISQAISIIIPSFLHTAKIKTLEMKLNNKQK